MTGLRQLVTIPRRELRQNLESTVIQNLAAYLKALDKICGDLDPQNREYARQALRDLGEPGVAILDYLKPVMRLPLAKLEGPERRHRLLAEHSPHAGFVPVWLPVIDLREAPCLEA